MNYNWVILDNCSLESVLTNKYLAKNVRKCNSEEKLLMLKNSGHLSFNQMRYLLLFPMKSPINESSMENILYFSDIANIAGFNINMDTSKEKLINVHIKDSKRIHFKVCVEGISTSISITPPCSLILLMFPILLSIYR